MYIFVSFRQFLVNLGVLAVSLLHLYLAKLYHQTQAL